jgi:hypothetical protein
VRVASNQDLGGPEPAGDRKWTIMVFMGSAPLPDFADLSKEANDTLDQLRRAYSYGYPSSQVNVLVQVHGAGLPRRYYIGHGPHDGEEVKQDDAAPEDELPLIKFVNWALKTAEHRDEDYSLLVLWGHAYEFAIGPRKLGTGIDALDFAELAIALERTQKQWVREHPHSDGKLDIVGFDSCDIATIEVAWQIGRYAHYFLASQMSIPLPGWPYFAIVKGVKDAYDRRAPMDPHNLGAFIVRRYCHKYVRENTPVSLTLINLGKAPDVFIAAQSLATQLVLASAQSSDELSLIHCLFYRSQTWEAKPFVDVADLCLNLWRYSSHEGVVQAAAQLGDLLVRPTGPTDNAPDARTLTQNQPFVLEHARNLHSTARLQGISLYAPHVVDGLNWQDASYAYQKFLFAQNTNWGRLVEALAQPG